MRSPDLLAHIRGEKLINVDTEVRRNLKFLFRRLQITLIF